MDRNEKAESLEGDLCKQCGLCCQGAFHTRVELQYDEVVLISKYPFKPHPDRQAFLLPCAMFDGVCTAYDDRPHRCRKFRCGVLNEMSDGEISYDEAVSLTEELKREIAEVNDRMAEVGHTEPPPKRQDPLNRVLSYLKLVASELTPAENFERNSELIALSQRLKRKIVRFEPRLFDNEG